VRHLQTRHFYQLFRSATVEPRQLARRLKQAAAAAHANATTNATTGTITQRQALPPPQTLVVDKGSSLYNMLLFLGDALYGTLRAEVIKVCVFMGWWGWGVHCVCGCVVCVWLCVVVVVCVCVCVAVWFCVGLCVWFGLGGSFLGQLGGC
jgi:hypothetical protein